MPPTTNLHTLPEELLCQVLCSEILDLRDLLRCSEVCKRLNTTIVSTLQLRYICELHKSGLEDATGCWTPEEILPSVKDRLERLQRHREAWAHLHCQKSHRISIQDDMNTPGQLSAGTYEFIGGVHARCHRGPGLTDIITYDVLPSVTADRQARQWTIDLGMDIYDFGMDPEQDLLVLVEARPGLGTLFPIHFRTISTNSTHPDSRRPRIDHIFAGTEALVNPSTNEINTNYGFIIHVCDAQVAVLFRTRDHIVRRALLVVWNWKTGENTFLLAAPGDVHIHSFTFLSPNALLIVSSATLSRNISLDVRLITPSCPSAPPLVATFLFPPLNQDVYYLPINLRSSPARVLQSERTLCTVPPIVSDLFCPVPQARILSLHMDCLSEHWNRSWQRHVLFVHADAFLSYFPDPVLSKFASREEPDIVPWTQWSHMARWIDVTGQPRNSRVCHTHDYRFLHRVPVIDPRDDMGERVQLALQVLVFGPELHDPVYARHTTVPEQQEVSGTERRWITDRTSTELVIDPSTLPGKTRGSVFKGDVTSSLPYRTMTTGTGGFELCDGLMMDSERIVLLQYIPHGLPNHFGLPPVMAATHSEQGQLDVLTF